MKIGEVKLRISNTAMELIDVYFNNNTLNEKFINSTLKIILKQNLYKLDSILGLFADKNGEINIDEVINEYANMMTDEGIIFDLKSYVDNDIIKSFIPDKILVIKREDILNLLK
jgi:hypothetical protein